MIATGNSLRYGPGTLCRLDAGTLTALRERREQGRALAGACATMVIGALAYGFGFGIWHSSGQALYAALKMPLLFLAVALASAVINTMFAQVAGSGLSFRQVFLVMMTGMAITAAILGGLSPVILFFISQLPPAAALSLRTAMPLYFLLLLSHVTVFAFAGIAGNIQVYRMLTALTCSRRLAVRLLALWLLVCGLVGCQLSWIMSPFLARPGVPVLFLNPDAFSGNFFEYTARAVMEIF